MDVTRRNHPTIEDMRLMPIGQVIDLPADHLALLQEEARSRLDIAKRALDWIEGAREAADPGQDQAGSA